MAGNPPTTSANNVEHALEKAGYAIADATKIAAHAVAKWFSSWRVRHAWPARR